MSTASAFFTELSNLGPTMMGGTMDSKLAGFLDKLLPVFRGGSKAAEGSIPYVGREMEQRLLTGALEDQAVRNAMFSSSQKQLANRLATPGKVYEESLRGVKNPRKFWADLGPGTPPPVPSQTVKSTVPVKGLQQSPSSPFRRLRRGTPGGFAIPRNPGFSGV